ncbi:glycosyltransferase family 4 protein [Roseiconus nitratireducens]|uniref:Glycosyltransferase family 4 protein n=1 Tax=Roseiconus nitratireducens TaxID=2605748 RepID=A0A5M6DKR1_9BACT|nr:glycosyltransferase family 4 protein [Roseiconus nitratireducens]KAA5545925.1 glycosyltransferase family 4 protein [Roseiconus nitratireducens]
MKPRLLFLDDNIRDVGGHYLELASLLAEGGAELGYDPELVTHASLLNRNPAARSDARLIHLPFACRFQTRRMEDWSLGVDGPALVDRNLRGIPTGGSIWTRSAQRICDYAARPRRQPGKMLRAWAGAFEESVRKFAPQPADRIVVNTGGDFQMIALAESIDQLDDLPPLSMHVFFHFAVYDQNVTARAHAYGRQVLEMVRHIRRRNHQIWLHATTEPLTEQLRAVGIPATAVPYPTRPRETVREAATEQSARKIVLAGMPRAEKGRGQIRFILQEIQSSLLRSGRMQWSMQLPPRRWQRMIPKSLQDDCRIALADPSPTGPLEILGGNLSSDRYHRWLDSADVGLFLYDARRYAARCSGVLLEMMIRGVPVVVPNRCWLADQVRLANKVSGTIGWIYDEPKEIPKLLESIDLGDSNMAERCRRNADRIRNLHSGASSLRAMGIEDLRRVRLERAG